MKNIKTYEEAIIEALSPDIVLKRKLFKAVDKRDIFSMSSLIDHQGVDVNSRNNIMETPLHRAIMNHNLGATKFLLDRGADPNARDRNGWAPIHWAEYENEFMLLLDRGADPTVKNRDGRTPLHQCGFRKVNDNYDKRIDMLIDNGAKIDEEDAQGFTPLKICKKFKNEPAAKSLIMRGASVFKAFDDLDELSDFFAGDVSWLPESPIKKTFQRTYRSEDLFGED